MKARNTSTLLDQDEVVKIVEEKLKKNSAEYRLMPHAPEGNCERVSELRGNHIHEAAKALLVNVKISNKHSRYYLVVLPGDRKVDFDSIAKACNGRSATMADKSKVEALMQCEVGRVPPFAMNDTVGVLVDSQLVDDNKLMYFSPGRLDVSIEMKTVDYRKMIEADKGLIGKFSAKTDSVYKAGVTAFKPAEAKDEVKIVLDAQAELPKPN